MNSIEIELLSYPELLERKRRIDERLAMISIPEAPKTRSKGGSAGGKRSAAKPSPSNSPTALSIVSWNETTDIPFAPKTDTHWDFVMKGRWHF
jgi:hypothetical protein